VMRYFVESVYEKLAKCLVASGSIEALRLAGVGSAKYGSSQVMYQQCAEFINCCLDAHSSRKTKV
jgi:hypothetical protein